MVVFGNQRAGRLFWWAAWLRNGVAVSQSRNHHHTGHLPLAGADNYLGIVPLRASTCDGVRVRGLCMNPFTLVGACLLNPSPWPARVPRCPAHGRRLGPIAVSSLAARLLCVCPGVVQKRPLQVQNLTVFRPRATWQLQSTMASGRCSRNLTPSIHPPLSLSHSRCVTPTFPALAAAPAAPAPAALASLAFDCFLSVASLFVSSRTLTRPDHTLLATSIVQHGKSCGCAAIERT